MSVRHTQTKRHDRVFLFTVINSGLRHLLDFTCLIAKRIIFFQEMGVQKCWFFVTRQVKSNRCLRLQFITVIRNTPCRLVCVRRTDMRQRAFESPDLALYFEYIHHGCRKLRKFFTDLQRSESNFFFGSVEPADQNPEISRSEKIGFWWSNDSKKFFF